MDFECVQDCSDCCVQREYYPSKKFGKVGVLILPDEKKKIESLGISHGIHIKIIPRIGISGVADDSPNEVLAYQLMGTEKNGNTCPFLDTQSDARSPHGGYTCKIYNDRPLACRAYPVIESNPIQLDSKCKFCKECGTADSNLDSEMESLIQIKSKMDTSAPKIWRYATGYCDDADKSIVQTGWFLEK